MNLQELKTPFPATDIEWRVQSAGEKNGRAWARVLAYVTNRAIMDRLDAVCGPENWKNEKFEAGPQGGVMSGISIRIGEEWVTKWDGADNTDIESVKGGISSAMKRAAVQWGIGRYLYNLSADYANIHTGGTHYQNGKQGKYNAFRWDPPQLPAWALPAGEPTGDTATSQPAPIPTPEYSQMVDDYLAIFTECVTMQALQDRFNAERRGKINDELKAIIAAKDQRKKELSK